MDLSATGPEAVGVPARILYGSCPLCESESLEAAGQFDCTGHPLFKAGLPPRIAWMQCRECGHVFTEGYFNQAALQLLFSDTNPNQQPGASAEQNRWSWAKVVAKVAAYRKDGLWLDVGFGNGSLLFTAAEWGFGTYGLDLRRTSVERMRALGFASECVPLSGLEGSGRFDILSMFDALEHMPFPGTELGHAHRLLTDGGLLVLSLPNSDCTVWKFLNAQGANPYWAELEHYHNFSRQRLYALLAQYCFEALEYGVSDRYRLCMEVIARKA